ncbi:hypothetical protein SADUNF_Sadunf10G0088000 [Salix dunnii]|uniref:Uncharacterized protein n=1 Tax=Salix dunnii TaxID=1413687 RepID=A0A835JT58_9ROSI|nr:hypothetical protein SADUNF_Sadunf10G0088000 [Salix dunnii]
MQPVSLEQRRSWRAAFRASAAAFHLQQQLGVFFPISSRRVQFKFSGKMVSRRFSMYPFTINTGVSRGNFESVLVRFQENLNTGLEWEFADTVLNRNDNRSISGSSSLSRNDNGDSDSALSRLMEIKCTVTGDVKAEMVHSTTKREVGTQKILVLNVSASSKNDVSFLEFQVLEDGGWVGNDVPAVPPVP